MPPRLLRFILPLLIGTGLGLLYGWIIDPIQYVDITPEMLRDDYRADYVLMVAESYRTELDPDLAARRLAVFGKDRPAEISMDALKYAQANSFTSEEIHELQDLTTALQTYVPAAGKILP